MIVVRVLLMVLVRLVVMVVVTAICFYYEAKRCIEHVENLYESVA